MTRLLYLVDSCDPGAARTGLLALLARLDRGRWDPVVVSLQPPGARQAAFSALGVEVLSPGFGEETGALAALELLLEARRLPRLLGGRRVDLVHASGPASRLLGRLAARRLGARAVVETWRDADAGPAPRLERWTRSRVTRFHLPADGLLEPLQRLGVAAGRCVVVPDGVDLAAADRGLAIGREEARRRLGLFPTDLGVAFVGRIAEGRGLEHLVGAFRALLQEQPTARLLLAGDGPLRRSLEAGVAALRLAPFVRFLGEVAEPWPLLAAADLFVLPAAGATPPAALLEAMAAGLPAVALAGGAVPGLAADGREAVLVPPGDPAALAGALGQLAGSAARRREMGARARARVERDFSAADAVAALERLYLALLAAAPARA